MNFICKLAGCKIPDVVMNTVYSFIQDSRETEGLFGCDRCGRLGYYTYDSKTKKITRK